MRLETRNQSSTDSLPSPNGLCYYRSTDTNAPGCAGPRRPLCDVQRIGNRLANIAGQAVWTLTLAPTRTNYFQVLAYLNHVTDNADPDTNHRLFIQQIEINQIPQEPFSGAPAVANLSGVLTDDYEVPPAGSGINLSGAIPVAWGIISQAALINVLTIAGVSLYAAGTNCDYFGAAFGNGLDVVPAGYVVGRPFHM